MNNNFRLLLVLVTLFLILLISGFSCILVNQRVTKEDEKPKAWCGTPDPPYDSDAYATGQALFKVNCASCHNKNMKADMTGPALGGVLERWDGDTTRLYSFIRNAQVYIDTANDPYAIAIGEWDSSIMQSFPELTDEELDAILTYITTIYL